MLVYFKDRGALLGSILCQAIYNLSDDNPYQFFWHSLQEGIKFLQYINSIKRETKARYIESNILDESSNKYRASYFAGLENMKFIDELIDRVRVDFAECLGVKKQKVSLLGIEKYNPTG